METRPLTRGECLERNIRPCPFISCKWHMIWEKSYRKRFRSLSDRKIVFYIRHMRETCTLDVCDWGGASLEEISLVMDITRERVRQIEGKLNNTWGSIHPASRLGLAKIMRRKKLTEILREFWEPNLDDLMVSNLKKTYFNVRQLSS